MAVGASKAPAWLLQPRTTEPSAGLGATMSRFAAMIPTPLSGCNRVPDLPGDPYGQQEDWAVGLGVCGVWEWGGQGEGRGQGHCSGCLGRGV